MVLIPNYRCDVGENPARDLSTGLGGHLSNKMIREIKRAVIVWEKVQPLQSETHYDANTRVVVLKTASFYII